MDADMIITFGPIAILVLGTIFLVLKKQLETARRVESNSNHQTFKQVRALKILRGPLFLIQTLVFLIGWFGCVLFFYSYTLLHMMHFWMLLVGSIYLGVSLPFKFWKTKIDQLMLPKKDLGDAKIAHRLGFPFFLSFLVLVLNVHLDQSPVMTSVQPIGDVYDYYVPAKRGGSRYHYGQVRSPDHSILPFTKTVDLIIGKRVAEAYLPGFWEVEIKYRKGYFHIPWVVGHRVILPDGSAY